MKVGEQHLSLAEHPPFLRLGFLDLDDQLGCFEDLRGVLGDRGAGGLVIGIGETDPFTGLRFNHDAVPEPDKLTYTGRHHADPVFVGLDFLWHAHLHSHFPLPIPCESRLIWTGRHSVADTPRRQRGSAPATSDADSACAATRKR